MFCIKGWTSYWGRMSWFLIPLAWTLSQMYQKAAIHVEQGLGQAKILDRGCMCGEEISGMMKNAISLC